MNELCVIWLEVQTAVVFPLIAVIAAAGLMVGAVAQFGAIISEEWSRLAQQIFPYYLKGFLWLILGPIVLAQIFGLIGIPVCS